MRLDLYDIRPEGMDAYLSYNGHHFSKRMCEWAVSKMRDRNGKRLEMRSLEQVDKILKTYNVELKNDIGYDKVYVMHMCIADYLGSSITDERFIAMFVKDYLDDPDGYSEIAFSRFMADCIATGTTINWADLI